MEIISQFIKNLNELTTNIYFVTTNLEPLNMNNQVSNELVQLISNPEINDLIKVLTEKSNTLHLLLSPISSKAKQETFKHHYPLKETPYAKFIIDEAPIVVKNDDANVQKDTISYQKLIEQKNIQPIKRRKSFDIDVLCPNCGAPKEYIYSNSKGMNKNNSTPSQFQCKCCEEIFTIHSSYHNEISHHCPHCNYKLFLHHERSNYDVLVCPNDNCPFYLANKRLVENNQAEHLKTYTNHYKTRYTFRLFDFSFDEIKQNNKLEFNINSKIDLNKIHHSSYTLGLILTYYVNYGLSSRRTAQILEEVHDIKISHQTVVNYAQAAAQRIEILNENYDYDLSSTLTGDETYIKVCGKTNYVFFFSDTKKKIISSYRIFKNRDTLCAVKALYQSFNKYKQIPNDLTIVTDGNPIYNAAQVFFKLNNINFDLFQVIGVKNKDETSKTWRPYKQVEERLNRTYKFNYYGTNGYGSYRGANIYMVLYVCFYNFLRKHSGLGMKQPIVVDDVEKAHLMPNKWNTLLSLSANY